MVLVKHYVVAAAAAVGIAVLRCTARRILVCVTAAVGTPHGEVCVRVVGLQGTARCVR